MIPAYRSRLLPVRSILSRRSPGVTGNRLLLGLTARNVRRDTIAVAPVPYAARPISGLRSAAAILDSLRAPLTRHHD